MPRIFIAYAQCLTHLPLDNMAAILADDIFKCIFLNENFRISIQISLKFVPKGPIDNKSALVQVMAAMNRPQTITWSNDDPVYRCIYSAQLGLKQNDVIRVKLWVKTVCEICITDAKVESYDIHHRIWKMISCNLQ